MRHPYIPILQPDMPASFVEYSSHCTRAGAEKGHTVSGTSYFWHTRCRHAGSRDSNAVCLHCSRGLCYIKIQ